MALQSIGQFIKFPFSLIDTGSWFDLLIDTSGEKAAYVTYVAKSGDISKIGFLVGTVTSAQTLKVSLQGVDGSGNPDGTILAAGNAYGTQTSPGSSTFYTVTLTGAATVTMGQAIAVVIEFNATVGNLNIRGVQEVTSVLYNNTYSLLYTTSWAKAGGHPNVSLEYSDGSYAGGMTYPISAFALNIINSGSTPDEVGIYFQLAFPCRIIGGWAAIDLDADATLKLYDSDGSTVLKSISIVSAQRQNDGRYFTEYLFSSSQELLKNTWYRLTLLPGSVTDITVVGFSLPSVAAMDSLPLGQNCYETYRTNAGAWTQVTTNRPMMGLLIDALDDGVGGSGGGMPILSQR